MMNSKEEKHFIWPQITEKTKKAVLKQLKESISIYDRSGIIEILEKRFENYFNKKHTLLTNSGTSALHSMFVGANLKKGDEVICPAYTFFATVTPLFFTGAIPILVDCKEDGNIDPEEIKKKITPKTKAIIITHMWGVPCEMDSIIKIAKENNLLIFEDISHAIGATYKGKKVGTFGDASALSLQGQKNVPGGEGGALITNNDEIFYRALLFGHYNKRCKKEIPKEHPLYKFSVTGMGLKLRIHPIAAAIANEQFNNLDELIKKRRKNAKNIIKELSKLPGIEFPYIPKYIKSSWYALIIKYNKNKLKNIPIEKLYEELLKKGCNELDKPESTCPLNYHPLFQTPGKIFPDYNRKLNYSLNDFPRAKEFHENCLKLPVWNLDKDDKIIKFYIDSFKEVIKRFQNGK